MPARNASVLARAAASVRAVNRDECCAVACPFARISVGRQRWIRSGTSWLLLLTTGMFGLPPYALLLHHLIGQGILVPFRRADLEVDVEPITSGSCRREVHDGIALRVGAYRLAGCAVDGRIAAVYLEGN